jgi:hypothetical protein
LCVTIRKRLKEQKFTFMHWFFIPTWIYSLSILFYHQFFAFVSHQIISFYIICVNFLLHIEILFRSLTKFIFLENFFFFVNTPGIKTVNFSSMALKFFHIYFREFNWTELKSSSGKGNFSSLRNDDDFTV